MKYLVPASSPEQAIDQLTPPGISPTRKLFRPKFHKLLAEMPKVDAGQEKQDEEVKLTVQVLTEIRDGVLSSLDELDIPDIAPGDFGRIILAIEEPRMVENVMHGGTEIVLALWGKGFQSPVHGHAAGYIHEDLLRGAFDVKLYEPFGNPENRIAKHIRTIEQRKPGIFYSEFIPDRGRLTRSAVVHNFQAVEQSMSIHYLPEHVRNGDANKFTPVFLVNDFQPSLSQLTKSSPEEVMKSPVGSVFLVRSPNLPELGEHYIIITGGNIQKPRGLRREDIVYMPTAGSDILNDNGTLQIVEVEGKAREEFYEKTHTLDKFRISK